MLSEEAHASPFLISNGKEKKNDGKVLRVTGMFVTFRLSAIDTCDAASQNGRHANDKGGLKIVHVDDESTRECRLLRSVIHHGRLP